MTLAAEKMSKAWKAMVTLCITSNAVAASAAEKIAFQVLNSDSRACVQLAAELKEKVKLEEFTAPLSHRAGDTLFFEISLSKNFQLDPKQWVREASNVNLNSIIKNPYTKFLHHTPRPSLIDFFFGDEHQRTFSFKTTIAKNIGGTASHRLSLTLPDHEFNYCFIQAEIGTPLEILSDAIDITPPLVQAVTYDKPVYRPGDIVTVTFILSEPLRSAESDHIEFSNRQIPRGQDGRSFPNYDHNVVHKLDKIGETTYVFKFRVPETALPGSYHPDYFNRFDALGNFEDGIGAEDAHEAKVADDSPLVVSDGQ